MSLIERSVGIGLCDYELVALAVNDPDVVPKITDLCHPDDSASDRENQVRLALALFCCTWTAVHLLRPWLSRCARRARR